MAHEYHSKPGVGIVIGDPCGIGPEVSVKSWVSEELHRCARPVLVGSVDVVAEAATIAGISAKVRKVASSGEELRRDVADPQRWIDVIDPVEFDIAKIKYGQDVREAGLASGRWLDHADLLARQGVLDAVVMGPISSGSMKMAGTLGSIATNKPDRAYLLLRSGPLMIAHLTDHVPFGSIVSHVSREALLKLLRAVHDALSRWGIPSPRIAVAGLNPHAEGIEEQQKILPAVIDAQGQGISASGPISPDSVFRHCIEGRYDLVLALYHDQGHIAMKTWGFSGNSVVMLGPPYVHTTVAHGVAYEIAGRGCADHSMLLNASLNAAYLSAGRGFHS